LGAYEEAMFPRAEQAAHMSAESLEMCFRADAPDGLVEFMASFPDGEN